MPSELWTRRAFVAIAACLAVAAAVPAGAQVRVNPTGVNVNANGATTVFLTFGGTANRRAAEAIWCGELVRATPDVGFRCDPSTIYGRLPIRYDQSRRSGAGGFTDLMSIPPSVARRAYQAAEAGQNSSFFYVRRFVSLTGGPDEYVAVTCRLAGGGARVPFSLLDVKVEFELETPLLFVRPGETPPPVRAEIAYNGTGRLKGRWEVVYPGEEPPATRDLLTEGSLPLEERGSQRRYAEIGRFNVFLPPTGRVVIPGPDVRRLPNRVEGLYLLLLRVEATADKEGDSSLSAVGAGSGVVHSGAVAGFPLPPLRYVVGAGGSELARTQDPDELVVLSPALEATVPPDSAVDFAWSEPSAHAAYHRLEVENPAGEILLSAIVPRGIGVYRAPPWLREKAGEAALRWRVVALDLAGDPIRASHWRRLRFAVVDQPGRDGG